MLSRADRMAKATASTAARPAGYWKKWAATRDRAYERKEPRLFIRTRSDDFCLVSGFARGLIGRI